MFYFYENEKDINHRGKRNKGKGVKRLFEDTLYPRISPVLSVYQNITSFPSQKFPLFGFLCFRPEFLRVLAKYACIVCSLAEQSLITRGIRVIKFCRLSFLLFSFYHFFSPFSVTSRYFTLLSCRFYRAIAPFYFLSHCSLIAIIAMHRVPYVRSYVSKYSDYKRVRKSLRMCMKSSVKQQYLFLFLGDFHLVSFPFSSFLPLSLFPR